MILKTVCGCMFVLCLSTGFTSAECPDAWVTFDQACYLFSHEPKTFTDAENYCLQRGAHLVHIETDAENVFLKNFCNQLQTHNYWIGLTDTIIEGLWKWKDTDETAMFTNFFPGQPAAGHTENCAILYSPYSYKWGDYNCNALLMPICEKKFPKHNGIEIVG